MPLSVELATVVGRGCRKTQRQIWVANKCRPTVKLGNYHRAVERLLLTFWQYRAWLHLHETKYDQDWAFAGSFAIWNKSTHRSDVTVVAFPL